MLKDFFWEVFKNSGNIEAYMCYKELDEVLNIKEESFTIKDEVALSS